MWHICEERRAERRRRREKLTLKYYKKGVVGVITIKRRHSRHETDSKSNTRFISFPLYVFNEWPIYLDNNFSPTFPMCPSLGNRETTVRECTCRGQPRRFVPWSNYVLWLMRHIDCVFRAETVYTCLHCNSQRTDKGRLNHTEWFSP